MPDPLEYEWSVIKREQDEDRLKECDYCSGFYNRDTFKICPFCDDEGCEE